MPQPSRQLARLHTQYRDATQAVRDRTKTQVAATWTSLPDYKDASVEHFANRSSRLVAAGAVATGTLTAAFIESVVRERTGTAQRATIDTARLTSLRKGIDPVEVYMRPGRQVWWELSKGVDYLAAVDRGLTRALTLTSTDLQLAKIDAGSQAMQAQPEITAYERVTGPAPCELCQEAAGTLYKSDELMELHDNCSCDLVPVIGEPQFGTATGFGSAPTTENDELGRVLATLP